MKPNDKSSVVGRRDFLTMAGAAATATVVRPAAVRASTANSAIRLGMIGCGGRGNWIADLFVKTGKYRLVACADYFPDRTDAFGERFQVEPSVRFTTLSGYKRLLEQELDAVVVETPPYFHPQQAADAVDAGKHVFLAKPIAVDVPGCTSVAESGKKATAKKLVLLVDFQTRADDIYRETLSRVRQGAIGRLISAEARYPWSGNVHDRELKSAEERIRFWYQTLALSGDVIVEQDIHALDVLTWFTDSDPTRAVGTGGRAVRKYGNIWDHFAVTYHFPNDVVASFTSQKAVPGIRDEISCRIYGSDGVADTDYMGEVHIRGKNPYEGGRMTNLYTAGAQRNIESFYDLIARGQCDNGTVLPSVRSNLTCILGRTAAYRHGEVTWKEMIDAREALEPDLTGLKA